MTKRNKKPKKSSQAKTKEKLLEERMLWVIRIFGLFLVICWFFFYRTPISGGTIFYRMGWLAKDIVILIVLYKITIFKPNYI